MIKKQNCISKLAWCTLKSSPMRNLLIVISTALLTASAAIIFSVIFSMIRGAQRTDYMLYTLRELAAPFHLTGQNAWGPLLNPVFILTPVLLCSFLLIYQCFCLSITKDMRAYALMMVCGLTEKQKRALAVKQGLILWFFGVVAGLLLSLSVCFFIAFSWSPAAFFFSCLIALPVTLFGAGRAFSRLQNISPADALRFGLSPARLSLRDMSDSAYGAAKRTVRTGIRSWYIWNRLKRTKNYYLSEDGRRQVVLDGKKEQRQKLLTSARISTSFTRLSRMAFMNALRNAQANPFVLFALCVAVLIFSLTHHLVFGLDPEAYTDAKLEEHDFVLINATCLIDYHDPDPPLFEPRPPQPIFTDRFLETLKAREGLTVSILEVAPGAESLDSSLRKITEQMIYRINIDTDETHFAETEKYLESIFKNSYQVRMENKALTTFQAGVQLQIAYLLGLLLTCVVMLTGILGFINTSAINMNNRKGEFAVLRSMGMTGGHLRNMLLMEGLFLSLIVVMLTAPFFVPFAPPVLWIGAYTAIGFSLTFIPYLVYRLEGKKSISIVLQEIG